MDDQVKKGMNPTVAWAFSALVPIVVEAVSSIIAREDFAKLLSNPRELIHWLAFAIVIRAALRAAPAGAFTIPQNASSDQIAQLVQKVLEHPTSVESKTSPVVVSQIVKDAIETTYVAAPGGKP